MVLQAKCNQVVRDLHSLLFLMETILFVLYCHCLHYTATDIEATKENRKMKSNQESERGMEWGKVRYDAASILHPEISRIEQLQLVCYHVLILDYQSL
jgi:hypothetical protein